MLTFNHHHTIKFLYLDKIKDVKSIRVTLTFTLAFMLSFLAFKSL